MDTQWLLCLIVMTPWTLWITTMILVMMGQYESPFPVEHGV